MIIYDESKEMDPQIWNKILQMRITLHYRDKILSVSPPPMTREETKAFYDKYLRGDDDEQPRSTELHDSNQP